MNVFNLYCIFLIIFVVPFSMGMSLSGIVSNIKGIFKSHDQDKEFDPFNFLDKYGYSLGDKGVKGLLAKAFSVKDANEEKSNKFKDMISLFQNLYRLPVTGKLDKETIEQMSKPRCGFPDILDESQNFQPANAKALGNHGPASYQVANTKWQKTALKYKLLNYNIELGKDGTRFAISKAFGYWSKHAELDFEEVCGTCTADLVIEFAEADHGDGYPFDGPSGVLAHAFFPQNGKIHFDEAEFYTENSKEGVNLRLVAAHEIGHALGLDHSYTKGALMYPYYAGYVPLDQFDLDQDDILGIRSIYGKRTSPLEPPKPTTLISTKISTTIATTKATYKPSVKATTPTKTTTKIATKTSTIATTFSRNTTIKIALTLVPTTKFSIKDIPPCNPDNHFINAVFTSPENNIMVIVDSDELWEYNIPRKTWIKHELIKKYPGIINGVRGGVKYEGLTWFFKGRFVWAFKGFNLEPSYPKKVTDLLFPSNSYAATVINGEMHILRGSFAYKFNTKKFKTDGLFPTNVRKLFEDLPVWIEAAIEYNSEQYMFKDDLVYKMQTKHGHQKVLDGYPKKIQDAWFPCFDKGFRSSVLLKN